MLEDVQKFLALLKQKPKRAVAVAFIIVVVTVGGAFIVKYAEKKAENFASPNPATGGLNYEIGTERANENEYDEYIKIYNLSTSDVYIESVQLQADMGNGLFRQAILYEPQGPEALAPKSFKEFRFRVPNKTAGDEERERSAEYATYTGKSFAYVRTTTDMELKFETRYHPYFIDRLKLGRLAIVSKKTAIKIQ